MKCTLNVRINDGDAILDVLKMDAGSEHRLKHALALAIVQERKLLKKERESLKERAIKAETELRQLKASIEGNPIDEGFLQRLTELEAVIRERHPSKTLEEIAYRQAALSTFLKNVHAIRTAQVKYLYGVKH